MYEVNNLQGTGAVSIKHENGTTTLSPGSRDSFRNIENLQEVLESDALVKEDGDMLHPSDLQDDGDDGQEEEATGEQQDEADEDQSDEESTDEEDSDSGGEAEESSEDESEGQSEEEASDEEQADEIDFTQFGWNDLQTIARDTEGVEGPKSGRGKDDIISDLEELDPSDVDLSGIEE